MTMPNINAIPNEIEHLNDLWNYWKKQLKLEFNCHHIGTIQSFNPETQTAQVTVNYTKTFLMIDAIGDTTVTTPSYPTLIECPCIVIGGGGGYLSFPITAGDECLILFNDRDMSNWYGTGSTSSPPPTGTLHSFSDAVILVGIRSVPNTLVDYDGESVTLNYLGKTFKLNETGLIADVSPVPGAGAVTLEYTEDGQLTITNETGEFVSSIVQLFTDISTGTTNTVFGPQLLVMPTFVTDLAVLQSFL